MKSLLITAIESMMRTAAAATAEMRISSSNLKLNNNNLPFILKKKCTWCSTIMVIIQQLSGFIMSQLVSYDIVDILDGSPLQRSKNKNNEPLTCQQVRSFFWYTICVGVREPGRQTHQLAVVVRRKRVKHNQKQRVTVSPCHAVRTYVRKCQTGGLRTIRRTVSNGRHRR